MNINSPSYQPEQQNNNDTNVNQLVSSILEDKRLTPRITDSDELKELLQKFNIETIEKLKEYKKEQFEIQKKAIIDKLNLKIKIEAKIRVNNLITQYRNNPKLHTPEITSLFENTIIVKRKTTLREMDDFENAINNELNKGNEKVVYQNDTMTVVEKDGRVNATIQLENSDDGLEELDKKKSSRDEVLFTMVEKYLAYEKSPKQHIEKEGNTWETDIDKQNLSEKGKEELKILLNLTKELDIDNGEIGIIGGEPVLEIDTFGSNILLSINDNGEILVSGQRDGKLFTEKIAYEELIKGKQELKESINDYESKSKEELIKDALGLGAMTLGSSIAFLIKTGLSIMFSGLSLLFAVNKGINIYNKNNLERNESIIFAKELKESKTYEQYKELFKPYIYGIEIGYIESYSEEDGVYTFKTVDGIEIKEKDFPKTMEKFWKHDSQNNRIKNTNESNKYKLLKALKESTIGFEYIEENKYDLDFTGLFDDTTVEFDGDKVILKTDTINNGTTFEYDINDKNLIHKILQVDLYLQEIQKLSQIENDPAKDIIGRNNDNEVRKQEQKIEKLKKEIMLNKKD